MSRVFLGAGTLEAGAGGIARVARLTAKALIRQGHDLVVASLLDHEPQLPDIRQMRVLRGSKLRFLLTCQRAALSCEHFVYDHAGLARAHPRAPGLKRPFIVWMHGIEAWEALRPEAARMLRGAAIVVVNSHYTLQRFQTLHGPLPQAEVCWLATEDDDAAQSVPAASAPVVLILGRLVDGERYKGHAELIAAWPNVIAEIPAARLVIAGSGSSLAQLRHLSAASGAGHAIDFLGYVPECDMPALWRRTSVFAMPSQGEGFGLVYIEAMRQGIPVVASLVDAAPEINLDGKTGFNVSLVDRQELAARLVQLLANPGLAKSLGEAGRARWREHFTFSAFERRFAATLAGRLSPARSSRPERVL